MNRAWMLGFLLLCVPGNGTALSSSPFMLDQKEATHMGLQIWRNECGGKREGLTSWNQGEEFASLGIGHFIWYPEGEQGPFKEMFPSLLAFLKQHGVSLPTWLNAHAGCPWQSREKFLQAQNDPNMEELRQILIDHIDLQICFMVERLHRALPTLLKHAHSDKKEHVASQFYRLAQTPNGLYVLLDYLNFKGEGVSFQECYNGQGWGLLQVLERMEGVAPGTPAIQEFAQAAKEVLHVRVQNAPAERREQRWIKGWCNRIESYLLFRLV